MEIFGSSLLNTLLNTLLDPSASLALTNKKLFDQLGPSGSGNFSEDTKYRTELQNQINNSNLPEEVKQTASELPSSWKINSSQTEKKNGYNPTAAKAQWQKDAENFIGNRIWEWVDNVTNTYTPKNIAETTYDTFSPLGEAIWSPIDSASYEVNPLDFRKEQQSQDERRNVENHTGGYEYLNDIIDNSENEDEDQSYKQMTQGEAIEKIASKMVNDPMTELSDYEKSLISNKSDSWNGDWSLPYIMASDKAYRESVNNRADHVNASGNTQEKMNKLVAPEYEYNLGPISLGQKANGASGANTNMGYYIDPDNPTRIYQEYNYQPYSNTDQDMWAYTYGTDGTMGRNTVGENANTLNNFFDSISNLRYSAAKNRADKAGRVVHLEDGTDVPIEEFRNNVSTTVGYYDPNVIGDNAEALASSGMHPIDTSKTKDMDSHYMLIQGSDGNVLPISVIQDVEVDPRTNTFTVRDKGLYDGTYNADDWTEDKTSSFDGTLDQVSDYLGLSKEQVDNFLAHTQPFYYTKSISPNDPEDIRENFFDTKIGDSTVTADDMINYYQSSNIGSDGGPLNLFKENYDSPWAGITEGTWNPATFAENIAPFMTDTGLGSWQYMVPGVNRVAAPLWSGARAIADMQGLSSSSRQPDGSYERQDLTPDQGYSNTQLWKKAFGEFADPAAEKITGIGGKWKGLNNLVKRAPRPVQWLADTAGEGIEEMVASPFQQAGESVDSFTFSPNGSNQWKEKVWNPTENRYMWNDSSDVGANIGENLLDNFAGGAIFSAPLNGVRVAMGPKPEKKPPKRTKYSENQDYNLDSDYTNYYDQYIRSNNG